MNFQIAANPDDLDKFEGGLVISFYLVIKSQGITNSKKFKSNFRPEWIVCKCHICSQPLNLRGPWNSWHKIIESQLLLKECELN